MKMLLEAVRRKNVEGEETIAPFINGKNVWDIAPENWTDDVQKALLRAYDLGVQAAYGHIMESRPGSLVFDGSVKWPEPIRQGGKETRPKKQADRPRFQSR